MQRKASSRGTEVSASDARRRRAPRRGKMHVKDFRYLEKNREELYRRNRAARIMKLWGLTVEEYDILSFGVCPICKSGPTKLQYDHDHLTGKLRRFICGSCNKGLGLFKDDPELLRKAAEYLDSHR